MGQDEDAVQVHDHLPSDVRRRVTGQLPDPFTHVGPDGAGSSQDPSPAGGEGVDEPGDGQVGGDRPEHRRFGPQHGDIGQAVPAQRHRERHIQQELARIMHRPGLAPRRQGRGYRLVQAGLADRLRQQHGPGLGDHRPAAALDADMRIGPDTLLHWGGASFLAANRTLSKSHRCRSGALPAF